MKGRTANVFLHGALVGTLLEDEQGWIELRLTEDYRSQPSRPVLGQWFEDHLHDRPRGQRPGELPTYFENFIPEGDLKVLLHERLGVPLHDDLGLLCAIGDDLPGAVIVQLAEGDAPLLAPRPPPPEQPEPGLRFSLAGVQLKFSMLRHGERFVLPGRDLRGDWIAKISMQAFPGLARNEWLTMEWARLAGFQVPATELRPLRDLVDLPHEGAPDEQVYLVQRYDRSGGHRLHQEDFQQIVGRRSSGKYSDVTYESIVLLAMGIIGANAYEELLRRLTFVVASGNDDAHMKNWSVVYPHPGTVAFLSPLYDQVFTGQWPDYRKSLALKLGGSKDFAALDRRRFGQLAARVGQPADAAMQLVDQAVLDQLAAWRRLREHASVDDEYRAALIQHWQRVPLLQPLADQL